MSRVPRIWDVYKIFATQTNPPKPKYIIITHVPNGGSYCMGMFINSERNAFQQQEHLDNCFIEVPVSLHPFLSWNSYAACGDVVTFMNHLMTDQTYQGRIHSDTAADIIRGAATCPLLRQGHKKIISALTPP